MPGYKQPLSVALLACLERDAPVLTGKRRRRSARKKPAKQKEMLVAEEEEEEEELRSRKRQKLAAASSMEVEEQQPSCALLPPPPPTPVRTEEPIYQPMALDFSKASPCVAFEEHAFANGLNSSKASQMLFGVNSNFRELFPGPSPRATPLRSPLPSAAPFSPPCVADLDFEWMNSGGVGGSGSFADEAGRAMLQQLESANVFSASPADDSALSTGSFESTLSLLRTIGGVMPSGQVRFACCGASCSCTFRGALCVLWPLCAVNPVIRIKESEEWRVLCAPPVPYPHPSFLQLHCAFCCIVSLGW